MSIITSFLKSFDDTTSFSLKSYAGCELEISLVNPRELIEKNSHSNSGKRLKVYEISGRSPLKEIIVLRNKNKELGNLTNWQIKDILDDLGFNVGVIVNYTFASDFTAAMGIGKFSIPFYGIIPKILGVFTSRFHKLLYLKLAPAKKRLHIRVFEMHDGSWAIAAHTEINWLNINIPKVLWEHLKFGHGDYVEGARLMSELLFELSRSLENHRVVKFENIKSIVEKY